jgi:hypothetical protein
LETIYEAIEERVGPDDVHRIHLLMDHRANRARYEKQLSELEDLVDNG